MICFPNAKINIGLNVVAKRPDGFHDLETVFYPIDLCDALEFIHSETLSFKNTGLHIEGDFSHNLVVKAWEMIGRDFNIPPVNIHLHKVIPFGAGLGGGSADAAFMLVMLNKYFELQIPDGKLKEYAARLGSDCTFFINNKPSFATGRGEILEDIAIELSGKKLVLVNPGIHVPTKDAFASIKPQRPVHDICELMKLPISQWKDLVCNDFENSIFPRYPAIKAIKTKLYELGALYASMSGSGSSVYGIFDPSIDTRQQFPGYFAWESEMM